MAGAPIRRENRTRGRSRTTTAFFPDPHLPVMFMELVGGKSLLSLPQLDADVLDALADATKRLHAISSDTSVFPHEAVATAKFVLDLEISSLLPRLRDLPHPAEIGTLTAEATRWLNSSQPAQLLTHSERGFGRGDTNLTNCIWDGKQLRFVDFEYAGWLDPVLELADPIEGVWARRFPDVTWEAFVGRFNLTDEERVRFVAARRLCALHWVYLLWRNTEFGPKVSPELHAQIERALTLFS